MAVRAEALIARWRAKSDEELRRDRIHSQLDVLATARGYSGRARQRLHRAADKVFGDPFAELNFFSGLRTDDARIRLGKRPGRPSKAGLW